MATLIRLVIAAFIFWLIIAFLVPMLPGNLAIIGKVFVVVIAIVYLLTEISGSGPWTWPWNRPAA